MKYGLLFFLILVFGHGNAQIDRKSDLYKDLINTLEKKSDTIFIENRKTLLKFQIIECNDNYVHFSDKLSSGERIEIEMKRNPFNASKHKLELDEPVYKEINGKRVISSMKVKNLIDNQYSYGIDGNIPNYEIGILNIKINEKEIEIPSIAYSNLYEPHLCEKNVPIEIYESSNGKYIYLYMFGSDGAGSYCVKWIFDKNKYISRIITDIEYMNGFDFIDAIEE
jgi:hypothetical protein